MGSEQQVMPFGKPMREHFLFAPNYINLNHGSYGSQPHHVKDQQRVYQDLVEAGPDKFMRYTGFELLNKAREAAAAVVNVPTSELVFVQNASSGVNIVLRNLVYKPGDAIIWFDTAYAAVNKTILSVLETNPGLEACKVDYDLPCPPETIVRNFHDVVKDARNKGLNPKVAVFDTIVSVPGVRFPFEALTEACRNEGVLSCVDAAHGIGQVSLDLGKLDADFLVSNCHKWFFTPRSSAIFHVPARNQHLIRTTYPTSHGYRPVTSPGLPSPYTDTPVSTDFTILFQQIATTDNTPFYCFPHALEFRNTVCGGESAIIAYTTHLAYEGGNAVARILGTQVLEYIDPVTKTSPLRDCAFANVELPLSIVPAEAAVTTSNLPPSPFPAVPSDQMQKVGVQIEQTLLAEFDTFVPVFYYRGKLWTRLSAQIYLDLQDFEWIGGVLKEVCEKIGRSLD